MRSGRGQPRRNLVTIPMADATVDIWRRDQHLALCLFGGGLIGLIQAVNHPALTAVDIYYVTGGWLLLGGANGLPLWWVLRRKLPWSTPLVFSVGIAIGGVISLVSVSQGGRFLWPLLALWLGAAGVRWRCRDAPVVGYCVICGYDLRGLDKPRCPECGQPFDSAQLDERWNHDA